MTNPDPVIMQMAEHPSKGPYTLLLSIKPSPPVEHEPTLTPSLWRAFYRSNILKGAALLAKGLGYHNVEVVYDGEHVLTSPVNVIQGCEEPKA